MNENVTGRLRNDNAVRVTAVLTANMPIQPPLLSLEDLSLRSQMIHDHRIRHIRSPCFDHNFNTTSPILPIVLSISFLLFIYAIYPLLVHTYHMVVFRRGYEAEEHETMKEFQLKFRGRYILGKFDIANLLKGSVGAYVCNWFSGAASMLVGLCRRS